VLLSKPPLDSSIDLSVLGSWPNAINVVVTCYVQGLEVEWHCTPLYLSCAGPAVCPDLAVVSQALPLLVKVIQQD